MTTFLSNGIPSLIFNSRTSSFEELINSSFLGYPTFKIWLLYPNAERKIRVE